MLRIDVKMTLNSGSMLILALRQEFTIESSIPVRLWPQDSISGRSSPNMTLAAIQQHQMNMGETLGVEASKLSVARQLRVVMARAAARQAEA